MGRSGAPPDRMLQPVLASERAVLRPFDRADAHELLVLFRCSEVRRYLLDGAVVSEAWIHEEIAASERRFADSGTGLWSVRITEEDSIAGFVGFRPFFEPPQLQLLYGLAPGFTGRGLATEVAARVCVHAFEVLQLSRIAAAVDTPNHASIRVLRRLGMREVRRTKDGAAGTVFFALERGEWPG